MLHKCGFCQGIGKVHRSIKLTFSICEVCSGRGTVHVDEPVITCAFCAGTGIQPNAYPYALLTCDACSGKGVATLAEPSVLCPDCLGKGRVIDDRFYCLTCKGKGRVEVNKKCGVIE
jgi:DnaJ-class molecular chaperone